MNATDDFIKALDTDAPNLHETDKVDLEALALAVLKENDLAPRIGQPLPIADALLDVVCDHSGAWDDEVTSEWGSGLYLVGRVIVGWDEQGFRSVEVHWSASAAREAFDSYRVFYASDGD